MTVAALVIAGPAVAKVKPNSENNSRLGPDDSAGEFLGFPQPTFQWHGCKATSIWTTPRGLPEGAPELGPGTKPKAVSFNYNPAAPPYVSWKVNAGYKICGVQVMVELSNPDVDSLLFGSAGYTSGKAKGSTAKNGKESIKVKIPKNGIGQQFEGYEGRTYSMSAIDGIAVFVKKK